MLDNLGTFGKFIETFGFPTLVATVAVIMIVSYFKAKISAINEEAKLNNEKSSTEISLMKEERIHSMNRNDDITKLALDVQTKQVEQLTKLNDNMDNLNALMSNCCYDVKSVKDDVGDVIDIVTKIQHDTGATLLIVRENNKIIKNKLETSDDNDKQNEGDD